LSALLPWLLLAAGLAGCAGSPEFHTETRPNSVLATAHTYTLLPPDDFTEQQVLQDAALRARMDELIRAQLAAKGLREAGKGQAADLLVRYVLSVQSEVLSPPPIGRPMSNTIGTVTMQAPVLVTAVDNLPHDVNARDVREGVMAVDVLAPESRDLLWRATISQVLGGGRDKILEHTQRTLDRAFRDLPVGAR
jgi:hypothetical protein